jgi:hypothetical protein
MSYPSKPRQEDPNAEYRAKAPEAPRVAQLEGLPSVSSEGGAPKLNAMPIGDPIAIPNLPNPIAKLINPTPQAQSGSTPDRQMADLVNRVVKSTPLAQIGNTYAPFVEQMKLALQNRMKQRDTSPSAWERQFDAMPTEMAQLVTRQLFDRAQRPQLPDGTGRIAEYMQAVDTEHQRRATRGGRNG